MADIYIPNLHSFAMDNVFTGSQGMLRFKISPRVVKSTPKEVDFAQSAIFAEYWHGVYCYEKSEMEGSAEFPMSEEGRLALKAWLESKTL